MRDTDGIVEIFGRPDSVDEIGFAVVFDGTSEDANFDRAVPMIRMAQTYVTEKAAMFIGSELDTLTALDAIPARSVTKRFGDKFVHVYSIDMVDLVGVQISIGHAPTDSAPATQNTR